MQAALNSLDWNEVEGHFRNRVKVSRELLHLHDDRKFSAFAELVGMNPNSISNYARNRELPTHLALIAVFVAELGSHGLDYRQAIARVEVAPKKPRGGARRGRFGGDRQISLDMQREQAHD
jgi:transcriptional regulator with XRE-family HTH domain